MDQSVLVQYSEVMEEIKGFKGEDPEAGPVFIGSAGGFGYSSWIEEGRDHRSDQDHGDPGTGVQSEGKDPGTVHGDAGGEGGRAPGADL